MRKRQPPTHPRARTKNSRFGCLLLAGKLGVRLLQLSHLGFQQGAQVLEVAKSERVHGEADQNGGVGEPKRTEQKNR